MGRRGGPGALAVARGILLAVLFVGPLALGAVHPWASAPLCLLALTALFAVAVEAATGGVTIGLPRAVVAGSAGLVAVTVLALVPLHPDLVARLAPDRLAALAALRPEAALPAALAASVQRELPRRPWVPLAVAPGPGRAEALAPLFAFAVLVVAAATLRRERDLALLAATLAATGGLGSALGLLQLERGTRLPWFHFPVPPNAHPFGPYINRNHYAGLVELALPWALALAVASFDERRRRPERAALGLLLSVPCAVAMAAGLAFAGSRGGALATALGLVVFGRSAGRRLRRGAVAAAGLVALAALLADRGRLLERVLAIEHTDGSVATRLELWRSSLALLASNPLLGVGPGGFADAIARFERPEMKWFFEHPESDFLWLATEAGAAGAALALLALGPVVGRIARRIRRRGAMGTTEPFSSLWPAAASAGLAAILVHGLVDVNLHVPANLAIAAALAAVVATTGARPGSPDPVALRLGRRAILPLALGLAGAAVWLLRAAGADALHRSGLAALTRPEARAAARVLLERATALDPRNPQIRLAAARALASPEAPHPPGGLQLRDRAFAHRAAGLRWRPLDPAAAFEAGWNLATSPVEPEAAPAVTDYAERLLLRAAQLDPGFPHFRARHGLFLVLTRPDRLGAGLEAVRAAAAADPTLQEEILGILERRVPRTLVGRAVPDRPENRLLYAERLERLGEVDEALRQYARTVALAAPSPATRSRFRREVARRHLAAERWGLAVELLEAEAKAGRTDADLLAALGTGLAGLGRFDAAQQALGEALRLGPRPDLQQTLAWVAWNRGDHVAARAAARAALGRDPDNVQALLVIALVEEATGELGRAHLTLERLEKLRPGLELVREARARVDRRMAEAYATVP